MELQNACHWIRTLARKDDPSGIVLMRGSTLVFIMPCRFCRWNLPTDTELNVNEEDEAIEHRYESDILRPSGVLEPSGLFMSDCKSSSVAGPSPTPSRDIRTRPGRLNGSSCLPQIRLQIGRSDTPSVICPRFFHYFGR